MRTRTSREVRVERPAFIHRQVVEMMRWNALQVWRNLLEGATPIALPIALPITLPIALPITLPLLKIRYTDNRKGGGDKAGWKSSLDKPAPPRHFSLLTYGSGSAVECVV